MERAKAAVEDAAAIDEAAAVRSAVVPLARRLRQSGNKRLTPTQFAVLGAIARSGPLTLGQLATSQHVAPATITKVTDALEGEGLVERMADRADRRVCLVQATPAGRTWLEDNRDQENAWLAERIARLNAADRAALIAALPALTTLLDDDG